MGRGVQDSLNFREDIVLTCDDLARSARLAVWWTTPWFELRAVVREPLWRRSRGRSGRSVLGRSVGWQQLHRGELSALLR